MFKSRLRKVLKIVFVLLRSNFKLKFLQHSVLFKSTNLLGFRDTLGVLNDAGVEQNNCVYVLR